MESNGRRTGLHAATGVLIAVLVIAGVFLSGVQFPSIPSIIADKGTLIIMIMDKPIELKHLNITIDWIKIKGQNENWVDLVIKGDVPFYFDLLALQNVTETLSETLIPAGNYTMIKMHVLTANATYPDDTTTDLNVPSNVIKVILKPHLNMKADGSITVLIDLQPDDLKSIAVSHNLNLRPVIRARFEG